MSETKNVVREGNEVVFADGVSRTVFPLTIRQLRKFLKLVKDLKLDNDAENMTDEDIDQMIDVASLILSKDYPDFAADKDALEDALDLKCFAELTAWAMGSDPNE